MTQNAQRVKKICGNNNKQQQKMCLLVVVVYTLEDHTHTQTHAFTKVNYNIVH